MGERNSTKRKRGSLTHDGHKEELIFFSLKITKNTRRKIARRVCNTTNADGNGNPHSQSVPEDYDMKIF
jgi:hypothetical protein